jgi:hypothetical protein
MHTKFQSFEDAMIHGEPFQHGALCQSIVVSDQTHYRGADGT